ncbi:AAA family ATPase [Oscillatoria sp. FACHB-1406]|uniref:bifunctional aminoglycoside phosphotransferase/ATP-binding protein n=1 Tax=Oscillatoria sp. FACHB-1406 TaxID=2692846 RepID=UPI001688F1DF|nr:AAA family ATPase [Oscillatoria sp. FACHB-1406]MBD2579169.1 AAA family ATPase [Oscillatoria sp. FACHB-1406]
MSYELGIIQQMQQPEFYPHPVKEPIELLQTHASYVFLTGDYTYKIKKSVNFGFFDYSTLEKRQHFCQEELRMNRDLAPEIYLEVLPITCDGERYTLQGKGAIIEYAIKMRQFPQTMLWSHLFEQGELTIEWMEELGRTVAAFHQSAKTNDYIRSFGEVEKIKAAFDENYQQSEPYIGRVQTQQQFEETKQFSDRFFECERDLLKQRQARGKIREVHGDLHLKNICLWEGKVRLFDRIEFNEEFRFVDTMYDVAFAVMDLEARGRVDLGNAFLNTYLERTGDWEGLQVLPLYLSRQAYVRAKVNSFLLDDAAVPPEEKEKAKEAAENYYRLAWNYTKTHRGRVAMMSGLSGSGKSTVARQLGREWGAIHLRSDAVRKHLAGLDLQERGDDTIYTPEMNQKTYGRLLELAEMLVQRGFSAILDAKYDRVALRKPVVELCESLQVPLQILYCNAPLDVLRDRVAARSGDISDATPELLARQRAAFESFTPAEQRYVRAVEENFNSVKML